MKNLFPFWRTLTRRAAVGAQIILLAALSGFRVHGESVINTVHNLSVTGPGTLKAATEKDACVFCHTVHRASGVTPLWNHSMSTVSNYVVYSSQRLSDLNITIPQPNGSSRLCLSCHDGTVALGSVSSGAPQIQMQGTTDKMPVGDVNNLGTDLSRDHPISFVYDSALASPSRNPPDPDINDPAHLSNKAVRMDSQNRLQCTSCHNPHDNQFQNFLVMANDKNGSQLCLVCHNQKPWSSSAHGMSATPVPQALLAKTSLASKGAVTKAASRATTIAANGCANCHFSHGAGSKKHLLQSAVPEENCYVCHNGVATRKNIVADFLKLSIHPITLHSESHSPSEDPINPLSRHVVCADCHNAHAANATTAAAPAVSGALANVTGVTSAGGVIKPALKQYELCFRCHADSLARGPATVSRQVPQTNLRLAFSAANQSFHPVETIGKNQISVPSLITPWTTSSVMYCTDCHNSDSGPNAGGSGANGPHGSIFAPILERNLVTADGQPESAGNYALCYKCHDRGRVLNPLSFRFHESHVINDKAACTTCHDSHGVANAPHLVNFNTTYVTNGSLGMVQYVATGKFQGNCTLSCHGVDHKHAAY